MGRVLTCRTAAALGAVVVAFAVVVTVVALRPTAHHAVIPAHHVRPHHPGSPTATTMTGVATGGPPPPTNAVVQVESGTTTTSTPPVTPCPVQPLAGDGVWPVVDGSRGTGVAPACGILTNVEVPSRTQWTTTGSPTSCTWTTYATASADPGSVIATHSGAGPSLMAFGDAVAAVRAEGCGPWVPWPASDSYWLVPPSPSTTPFGDGTYPFWLGISDGTWQASGGPDCRWEVLRGFTGTPADVMDAGSSTGPTIVTMAMAVGGDQTGDNHGGFASQGCGAWTYVGGASIR